MVGNDRFRKIAIALMIITPLGGFMILGNIMAVNQAIHECETFGTVRLGEKVYECTFKENRFNNS